MPRSLPKPVRLISDSGEQVGIVSRSDALSAAADVGLDLVEISPNTEPPVCRLMDYGKFLFQQNKRRAAAKKKQSNVQVKEIKFRPGRKKPTTRRNFVISDDF